jgi:hypothetical protein
VSDPERECPWNACEQCGEIVDVDDCFDGSLVRCLACDTEYEVVLCKDDSWMLIAWNPMTIDADGPDLEPPWNTCRRCEETVGVHGILSGSTTICPACNARYECCQLDDGSWMLLGPQIDDSEI